MVLSLRTIDHILDHVHSLPWLGGASYGTLAPIGTYFMCNILKLKATVAEWRVLLYVQI